jgi:L-iditol 2-dehydrogenase
MTAAFLLGPGALELREVPVPEPGAGEVLVRVEAALTCGTDIKTWRRGHARLPGAGPFGHEFAGTVAARGAGVSAFREGDAIACVPTAPCNQCRLCHAGRHNLCPGAVGRMLLGAYADYVLVPAHIVEQHLFKRPATLTAATAAALEPLACVIHGARRLGWNMLSAGARDAVGTAPAARGERVVVVGDGAIALLFARLAVLHGADALVLGRHEQRLAVARAYGASAMPAPDADAARDAVARYGGAAVVVECVGVPGSWRLASDLTDPGGTVMLFGGCGPGAEVQFDAAHLHYHEVDHLGAFHYTPAAVAAAWEFLCDGTVDPSPLVTAALPLSGLQEALDAVVRREAIKMEIRP